MGTFRTIGNAFDRLIRAALGKPSPPAHFPDLIPLNEVDVSDTEYGEDLVTVDCLISPGSQGTLLRKDFNCEVHTFTIAAWSGSDGNVTEGEVIVLRPVPIDHDWIDDVPELSLQRLSILLSRDKKRAVFEQAFKASSAVPELIEVSERLKLTVILECELFGNLELNRSYNWFEGKGMWLGEEVAVTFPTDENGRIDSSLKIAEQLWADQESWRDRLSQRAVSDLLHVKNEFWLEEGEPEISAVDFVLRIELDSITIERDGDFEFWYNDNDLFWGHSIAVSGSLKDGPTDACFHG